MILVTGGAGFIGSHFVKEWIEHENSPVINIDKLTYAGSLRNLDSVENHPHHSFIQGDIHDRLIIRKLLEKYRPKAIVHFAAETHVDRSISEPEHFIHTNFVGTFNLLDETLAYWKELNPHEQQNFRFLHVSTDEVYGSIESNAIDESGPYAPNNPYSASKAGADHLVRSYTQTYGLPTLTTHCVNNYGPFQFPEKLIPVIISNALKGQPLPVYGNGMHVRNWLYVTDHCSALRLVLKKGKIGETYNIGDNVEKTNLEIIETICALLDEFCPRSEPHTSLIKTVKGRPGDDQRYCLDSTKIQREMGWEPAENFSTNMRNTVSWYLENQEWMQHVMEKNNRDWVQTHYSTVEIPQ